MHVLFKRQIFRGRQSTARGQRPFDNRVVGQVDEHDDLFHDAGFLKAALEVIGDVVLDAHRAEHDAEVLSVALGQLRLPDDLNGQLVMRHTGAGENRQLLPADQRV